MTREHIIINCMILHFMSSWIRLVVYIFHLFFWFIMMRISFNHLVTWSFLWAPTKWTNDTFPLQKIVSPIKGRGPRNKVTRWLVFDNTRLVNDYQSSSSSNSRRIRRRLAYAGFPRLLCTVSHDEASRPFDMDRSTNSREIDPDETLSYCDRITRTCIH